MITTTQTHRRRAVVLFIITLAGSFAAAPLSVRAEEAGDSFGASLVAANFGCSGFYDQLVVGVPNEDIGSVQAAGMIQLNGLYMGEVFFTYAAYHQDSTGISDAPDANDQFGFSLATGDFDGDGCPDLAIGAPGENVGGDNGAGQVHIIHGGAMNEFETWNQDSSGVTDAAEPNDGFGRALAAGDFDGDGIDDLAIGVPGDEVGGFDDAGAVNVLYGTDGVGLTSDGSQYWSQASTNIEGAAEVGDSFGAALVAADFDDNGRDDLGIGAPDEDSGGLVDVGSLNVIFGSSSGLTSAGDELWTQDSSGVPGSAVDTEHFASTLGAGDFDDDGYADIAVGVWRDVVSSKTQAGSVNVMYGGTSGFTNDQQLWNQDAAGILGVAEVEDLFGFAVACGDFNDDGFDDLAVGAPGESFTGAVNAGVVHIIPGSNVGLVEGGDILYDQSEWGEDRATGDLFGSALTPMVTSYGTSLVVGAPGDDVSGANDAGWVDALMTPFGAFGPSVDSLSSYF